MPAAGGCHFDQDSVIRSEFRVSIFEFRTSRRGTEVVITGAPRKRLACQKRARGFESHPLRHPTPRVEPPKSDSALEVRSGANIGPGVYTFWRVCNPLSASTDFGICMFLVQHLRAVHSSQAAAIELTPSFFYHINVICLSM